MKSQSTKDCTLPPVAQQELEEDMIDFDVDLSEKPQRQLPQGCEARYQRSYQAGSAFVHVYDVENTDDKTPFELQEKQFTQPGDLALCAKEAFLDPHTSTELYVVSRV